MAEVEIFLACHNRIAFLAETLASLRAQTYKNLKIIVSDNSSNEDVANWVRAQNFTDVELRPRRPYLPVIEHLDHIRREAKAPFFMIFHDDDLLYPDAIERLVSAMEKHPTAAAVGGNAHKLEHGQITENTFQNIDHDRVVNDSTKLIGSYLFPFFEFAPFPSYLYRRTAVQSVRFDHQEAGKYSDVTFLAKLAGRGPIVWLAKPTMAYRIHDGNDSQSLDLKAIYRFSDFVLNQGWRGSSDFGVRHFVKWHELNYLRDNRWTAKDLPLALQVVGFFLLHPGVIIRFYWRKFIKPRRVSE